MAEPRIPGDTGSTVELPCGQAIDAYDIDLGLREYACGCGDDHAVVMDVHPPTRFLPDFLVETLRETVAVDDGFGEFGTPHLMGLVLEEFPDGVAVHDASDDGAVGYALLWISDFDARRLHEVIVELVVELMDHAMTHADAGAVKEFEAQLRSFDVAAFVDHYRAERDLSSDDVPGY